MSLAHSFNPASSPEIAEKLVSIIRTDGLNHGDRMPSIRQLSARFDVRPHIVRDALLQVQSMGLVVVRPRARAVVRTLPSNLTGDDFQHAIDATLHAAGSHVFHLLDARLTLELELVSRAATQRRMEDLLPCRNELDAMHTIYQPDRPQEHLEHDVRFHLSIAQLGGNPVLTSMLKSLINALRPFLLSKAVDDDHAARTKNSHMEIYRALVAGDPDLARAEMKRHLQIAYDRLLEDVQSVPAIEEPRTK